MESKYFESVSDLAEFCKEPRNHYKRSADKDFQFRGTRTFEEALGLMVNGWPEGTALIEKFTSQFTSTFGSLLTIDNYFYDVTGQDFDLDRVLIGEPECWMQSEQVQVKAPALHTLKIVCNIGASGSIPKESIINRGAALIALVALLEKTRRAIEIELVSEVMDYSNRVRMQNRILAKSAGMDLDISKLAFLLAHPSMLRRIVARAKENFPNKTLATTICRSDYGISCDVAKESQGDIYMPKMLSTDNSFEPSYVEKWILARLQEQGVEMRKEGE